MTRKPEGGGTVKARAQRCTKKWVHVQTYTCITTLARGDFFFFAIVVVVPA